MFSQLIFNPVSRRRASRESSKCSSVPVQLCGGLIREIVFPTAKSKIQTRPHTGLMYIFTRTYRRFTSGLLFFDNCRKTLASSPDNFVYIAEGIVHQLKSVCACSPTEARLGKEEEQ